MAEGYIEDFQINASSETPHKPGSKGRLGDIGWCSRIKWENNIDTLQVVKLHFRELETHIYYTHLYACIM